MEIAPSIDRDWALTQDLDHLRRLLENGDIEASRAYVGELVNRWPDAEQVQHFAHVLAPPVARRGLTGNGRRLDREQQWIREHGTHYPGCWVALDGDRLIAADPELDVVLDAVEGDGAEDPFVFLQASAGR